MTMMKVAKLTGFSQATISRVINNHPGVSAETTRGVMEAIKQTGYQPRPRSHRKSFDAVCTGTVAMVVGADDIILHSELFTRTLLGVSQALGQHGIKMILVQASKEGEFLPSLKPGEVDGVLVVGACTEEDIIRHFGQTPVVWLTSHSDQAGDHILAGNEAIGRLAAEYLFRKGKSNLVFFNPDPSFQVYNSRWVAFRLMAEELGAQVCMISNRRKGLIFNSVMDCKKLSESLNLMVDEFSEKAFGTAGVFVPDDIVTAMLYPVLHKKGMAPGKDLLLISCCNEQAYLSSMEPKPATIDLGHEVMGHRAVEQLLWRIRSPELKDKRPFQVTISPMLVE